MGSHRTMLKREWSVQHERISRWWPYIVIGLAVVLAITLIIFPNKAGLDVPYGIILSTLVIELVVRLGISRLFIDR